MGVLFVTSNLTSQLSYNIWLSRLHCQQADLTDSCLSLGQVISFESEILYKIRPLFLNLELEIILTCT